MRSVALFLALSCSALALPQNPANGAGNSNRPEHPRATGHPNNSNHPHASPSGALAPSTATSSPGSETPTKTLSSTDTRGAWTYETLAPGQAPTKPNNAPLPEIPVFPPSTASPAFILPKFSEPAWGAFWSYSQPPVPATSTTQAPPSQFTASFTNEDIAAPPTTREYTFNMTYAAGWPSGYLRRLAVINNQFPGPLIEANQGDTIVVHVNNHLDVGQSVSSFCATFDIRSIGMAFVRTDRTGLTVYLASHNAQYVQEDHLRTASSWRAKSGRSGTTRTMATHWPMA